jgi:hypothetical protein
LLMSLSELRSGELALAVPSFASPSARRPSRSSWPLVRF